MNENIIFFFSGTGNSFDVTLKIAEKMKNTDVINISSIKTIPTITNYKRIGLVFPIYGFTMPNIVSKFILKLPLNSNAYYFCIVTLGGLSFGAEYRILEMFNKAKLQLQYLSKIFMPENYIIVTKIPTEKTIMKILNNSIKKVIKITEDIKKYKEQKPKKSLFYNLVKNISKEETEKWPLKAKNYKINNDCTKCKKCIRVCPVENIKMVEDEILFEEHCEYCLCCIHICPQRAINYGNKTIGKKRYINPNIEIEDMKKYCYKQRNFV